MYMRHRIYLQNHKIALLAEEDCHKLAKKRGFDNWDEWYHEELKNLDLDLPWESSWKEMMKVTNEFREKYKEELKNMFL